MFSNTLLKNFIQCFVTQKEMRPSYLCKRLNEDKDNPEKVIHSLAQETGIAFQPIITHGIAFNNAEQYLILIGEKTAIEFLKFKKWHVFIRL
jgi:hypothetical protein